MKDDIIILRSISHATASHIGSEIAVSMANCLSGEAEYAFSTQIMPIYDHLQNMSSQWDDWQEMDEVCLWQELCVCILSSGVPYEMATSAQLHLLRHNLLDPDILISKDGMQLIAGELSKPICLPKRKDGGLRKYRFPNIRARCLVDSASFLYAGNEGGLFSLLGRHNSEGEMRDFLACNMSGIGLKEASNFLRNIGYSSSLAIIDTHIVSFMKEANLIPEDLSGIDGNKKYLELESILVAISESNGLDLSILDHAIWRYMRGR
jgi:N-glycosylase/DNA lyase